MVVKFSNHYLSFTLKLCISGSPRLQNHLPLLSLTPAVWSALNSRQSNSLTTPAIKPWSLSRMEASFFSVTLVLPKPRRSLNSLPPVAPPPKEVLLQLVPKSSPTLLSSSLSPAIKSALQLTILIYVCTPNCMFLLYYKVVNCLTDKHIRWNA